MQSIAMAPRQCGHCYTVNAPTSNFCTTCGRPLTDEVKKSMEQIQREIEMTPEFQTVMGMLRERLEEGVVEG
jgi:predicted amidophosphoribosyltransferase